MKINRNRATELFQLINTKNKKCDNSDDEVRNNTW